MRLGCVLLALASIACGRAATSGSQASFTIASRLLGETRRVNVYTPPGPAATRLPVLYMPDGGVNEDFPHVAAAIDAAVRAGEMRPVFLVGIENTERRRDLTGPTEVDEDRKIAPRVGGSAAFRAFLLQELRPEIARRVRGNGETGIIGESLAGLFVVETFLLEPDAFDVYIALSPSLWWNAEALVDAAARHLAAHPARPRTFHLAFAGDDELDEAAGRLEDALREDAPPGLSWCIEPRPDTTHATIYRALAREVLRKVYAPLAAP